jgi:hypothetical protein
MLQRLREKMAEEGQVRGCDVRPSCSCVLACPFGAAYPMTWDAWWEWPASLALLSPAKVVDRPALA